MKFYSYKLSVLLIISLLFVKCSSEQESENKEQETITKKEVAPTQVIENQIPEFSINIIEVNENQFGYDILINGQPYIHQPHIPAIGGNNGFSSKEKAEMAGNFIIKKLNNNIMPPTITLDELDSLGVLD